MKKLTTLSLFLTLNLLFISSAEATVFRAIAHGAWEDTYVWDQDGLPTIGDTVVIDGFNISLSTITEIGMLIITNEVGNGQSELIINSLTPITLTISGNLNMTAENRAYNVDLHVKGMATLKVSGNVNMTRAANNLKSNMLRLNLYGDSKTYIFGDLTYNYKNSHEGESYVDISLDNNAHLYVSGRTSLLLEGGNSLEMTAIDSSTVVLDSLIVHGAGGKEVLVKSTKYSSINIANHTLVMNSGAAHQSKIVTGYDGGEINIDKNLKVVSTGPNLLAIAETKGPTSSMEVKGDIIMSAEGDSTVYIYISNQSPLYLGGDIVRSTNYGSFISKNGGELILNGSSQQSIPGSSTTSGTEGDMFSIEKITFSNTSSVPVIVENDLLFTETLNLTTGNISFINGAMMIVGPNATIQGASENAYIEGPIKKIGSTGSDGFLFPVGDATTYAPMRISSVTSATSEYIARFDGDPPPFGENKVNVDEVTGNQSWFLEPAPGSDSVFVTLYWDDATAMGATLEEELIVVSLDETDHWTNKGNTDVSLTSPGYVSSIMLGDPPPFGEFQLTLGLAPEGSLPVALTNFGAVLQKDKVYIQWHTSSEIDASHFVLERSSDKENFSAIYTTNSTGAEELSMKYSTIDQAPVEGKNYYRLKMVDLDGSFEYSHIEVVQFKVNDAILIYPNPVSDMLQIEGGNSSGSKTFEVYDRNGLLLYQGIINFEDGKFEISVDEINVNIPGTYFIRIIDGTESHVVKFLKVK